LFAFSVSCVDTVLHRLPFVRSSTRYSFVSRVGSGFVWVQLLVFFFLLVCSFWFGLLLFSRSHDFAFFVVTFVLQFCYLIQFVGFVTALLIIALLRLPVVPRCYCSVSRLLRCCFAFVPFGYYSLFPVCYRVVVLRCRFVDLLFVVVRLLFVVDYFVVVCSPLFVVCCAFYVPRIRCRCSLFCCSFYVYWFVLVISCCCSGYVSVFGLFVLVLYWFVLLFVSAAFSGCWLRYVGVLTFTVDFVVTFVVVVTFYCCCVVRCLFSLMFALLISFCVPIVLRFRCLLRSLRFTFVPVVPHVLHRLFVPLIAFGVVCCPRCYVVRWFLVRCCPLRCLPLHGWLFTALIPVVVPVVCVWLDSVPFRLRLRSPFPFVVDVHVCSAFGFRCTLIAFTRFCYQLFYRCCSFRLRCSRSAVSCVSFVCYVCSSFVRLVHVFCVYFTVFVCVYCVLFPVVVVLYLLVTFCYVGLRLVYVYVVYVLIVCG
jgi:hypothetical protein